ncbi:MAG: hypothetical protein SYC29_07415 [Planctomycetota bacterium]|nr:hypothetical protein [Planctomycetota bacterium]
MLSDYGPPSGFHIDFIQTDQGRARINGGASAEFPGSVAAALLGVAARRLSFLDLERFDTAGSDLVGMGLETAELRADPAFECLLDQYQPKTTSYMAAFSQTDLAQSFKPAHDNVGGAGIFLQPGVGDTDLVTIELWDALPTEGGERLASAATMGTQGTWAGVNWPPVAVNPGTTYYLLFTGNTTLGIAGDVENPYPDGHVFANPGFQPFPDFDYAFWTCHAPEDELKHQQRMICDEDKYFSNFNSTLMQWIRYDDFICTETGDIANVTFYGGGYDVAAYCPCDLTTGLAGFQVEIYTWEPGGPCDWHAGELLCSYYVPAGEVQARWKCTDELGIDTYRYSVNLPEPCHQEEGEHYVISIAADLIEPTEPCVFVAASTGGTVGEAAFSALPNGECGINEVDPAFIMLTEVQTIPGDFDGDGDVDTVDLLYLLGCWGTPCGDVDGDGDTDTADLLLLLGNWG